MAKLHTIKNAMRATRNRMMALGVAVLAMAAIVLLASIFLAVPKQVYAGLLLVTAFFIIAGIYLFILAYTLAIPKNHRVLSLLRYKPAKVVWVYPFISVNMPYGVQMFKLVTVWLHLVDGNQAHFRVLHSQLPACMDALRQQLPEATFGYSVEKEQLYRANPLLLLKK